MGFSVLLSAAAPLCETNEGGIIGSITDWLVSIMDAVGGIGVSLAIALESIFPPIPSEVILPLAGFTAARGSFGVIEAIIWATVGSLLGAWVLYGIARWIGLNASSASSTESPASIVTTWPRPTGGSPDTATGRC